jgi:uncharacterized protein
MSKRQVFVNLPVKDLPKSIAFFKQVGYTFNPQFTDETATCMIISDEIFAMLLTEAKFKSFLPKDVAVSDAAKTKEVLIALNHTSREEVDAVIERAVAAGGKQFRDAADHGFMYERSYQDLDGHVWEHFWMDPKFVQPQ